VPIPDSNPIASASSTPLAPAPSSASAPRIAAAIALAAVLASGCATLPPPAGYPPQWVSPQPAAQTDGCPDLSGTYDTRAADTHPAAAGIAPRLNDLFTLTGAGGGVFDPRTPDRHWPTLPGATTAALDMDAGALRIRLRNETASEVSLLFRRIHLVAVDREADAFYDCFASDAGPALRFVGRPRDRGGLPYLYGEKDLDVLVLFRGADGSLVVNRRIDRLVVTAVMLGSQTTTRSSVWWRYRPLAPGRPVAIAR
jgi:hypothetical protein